MAGAGGTSKKLLSDEDDDDVEDSLDVGPVGADVVDSLPELEDSSPNVSGGTTLPHADTRLHASSAARRACARGITADGITALACVHCHD